MIKWFSLFILFSFAAGADPMSLEAYRALQTLRDTRGLPPTPFEFVSPNEQMPQESRGILQMMQPGPAFFVGTERGFISAGLDSNIMSLNLVDRSDDVVFFNLINWVLLKVTDNHRDYIRLRFSRSHDDWIQAAYHSQNILVREVLRNAHNFEFWDLAMDFISQESSFHKSPEDRRLDGQLDFEKNPSRLKTSILFDNANYLFREVQYRRIKKLVDSDSIAIAEIDLANSEQVLSFLSKRFQKQGVLSLLDLSNAWQAGHLQPEGLATFLQAVKLYVTPQTLLSLTGKRFGPDRKVSGHLASVDWKYMGFTFSFIHRFGEPEDFVKRFFSRLNDNVKSFDTTINDQLISKGMNLHSAPIRCEILLKEVQ